ncbi:amidohydrolase/deacetylase family metallohydrolase [Virgibacillus profundi]|uniref:Amidohydrolase/deacetylase family metallohydrolase n=1 Tax=Virgibacillus profundi TaxID=2024555 RepID=A0A2A2II13_9BACI|nr:amidohydrolase/deacetylase family metallohydrolase [Virgibacillus profundi]PAV31182.1 amidohydrolase/deacetylase family metallohydrolase [Virgibacillus profundi]PXY55364.1 amidohydrolase/deacetylase family metallohydrolase [Virgibacillus profundi]
MNTSFVLRNAKLITEEEIDIVIEHGKIIEIAHAGSGKGQKIHDCNGIYVSSGWIDLHVHAFPEVEPYGDEIDEIGIKTGVTTIVDAGSCGADRISDLVASKSQSKTNLFAFLNISRIGLKRTDELSDLEWINKRKIIESIREYKDTIVGLKARISKSVVGKNGIEPLRMAQKLSRESHLPLMVHIGSSPPVIEEVVSLLEKDDIITHFLNGKANNLFDKDGRPLQALTDAVERGVHLDVGHGTASFSFKVAEMAKRNNIKFHTISTDIYRMNRENGPVFNMAHTLTKFLYLGYPLEEVIAAVTSTPANWLKKPELGRIKTGDTANLSLFRVKKEPVTLTDSEKDKRIAKRKIEPMGVVVNGEIITY